MPFFYRKSNTVLQKPPFSDSGLCRAVSKKLKAQAADSLPAPSKKFRGKRLYPHWPLCKRVFSDIISFAQIIIRFLEKMKLKLLFRTLPGKFPGAAAHILYTVRCCPAKNCFRFLHIRPKCSQVSINKNQNQRATIFSIFPCVLIDA